MLSSALLFACEADDESTGTESGAGAESAGAEMAGTETAGTEMAGTEAAGTETAGTETTESNAWTEPSDLASAYNSVQESIVAERDTFCEGCAMTEVCGDEFVADNEISVDDAGCVFIESTSEELSSLQAFFECQQSKADEAIACIAALDACDEQQFEDCLDLSDGSSCEMLIEGEYLQRIGVACFGEAEDYICEDGNPIPGDYVCDGEPDCTGGEDEADCSEE